MDRALSFEDIKDIFDGNIHTYLYSDLQKFNSVDELLEPYNRCIILFNWKPTYGHYCALFKRPNNEVCFFDSFGSKPDGRTNFKQIPKPFRQDNGFDYPYLSKLLYECPYNIDYNDKCLQDDYSSTCGRYCAARMACDDLSTNEFNKLFSKNKKKNDKIIIEITDK